MAEQASNCFERGCCRLNLRPCTESDEEPDKVQRDIVIESAEAAAVFKYNFEARFGRANTLFRATGQ